MPALVVQKLVNQEFGGGSANVDFTGGNVATGNAVIVLISMTNAPGTGITFAVSDLTNGSYVEDYELEQAQGFGVSIHSKRNVTGGFVRVTVTASGGTPGAFSVSIYEVSGLNNSASVLTGANASEGSTTTHVCSTTGVSGTGFACGVASKGGFGTTMAAGANYTLDCSPTSSFVLFQQRVGTLTSEQGPWTTTTATNTTAAMALYVESTGAALAVALSEPVIGSSVF